MNDPHLNRRFRALLNVHLDDPSDEHLDDHDALEASHRTNVPIVPALIDAFSGQNGSEQKYLQTMQDLMPNVDVEKVVLEQLGDLSTLSRAELVALRKRFALSNHPDLFRGQSKKLAQTRMSCANQIIDRQMLSVLI